jgi:putative colanic acid biosynthesis acetyltransferase WcaF
MPNLYYKNINQKNAFTSAWSIKEILGIRLWNLIWKIFFSLSPKYFARWRIFLLKIFGAQIDWTVFIYPSAKIYVPWLLKMEGRSCLGPFSEVYNLGPVHFQDGATLSQYSYICNGTHDLSVSNLPLMVGKIEIGKNVFIGAKVIVLPGINIGEGSVVGAGAVVTKDVESWTVVAGNPAKFIKVRKLN